MSENVVRYFRKLLMWSKFPNVPIINGLGETLQIFFS